MKVWLRLNSLCKEYSQKAAAGVVPTGRQAGRQASRQTGGQTGKQAGRLTGWSACMMLLPVPLDPGIHTCTTTRPCPSDVMHRSCAAVLSLSLCLSRKRRGCIETLFSAVSLVEPSFGASLLRVYVHIFTLFVLP